MKIKDATIDWLMEGDPAVQWQVQRDLLDEPPAVWKKTRENVAATGWGARYLSLQAEDGTWGGGIYGPKWVSTHYTLQTLRFLGLPPGHPAAIKAFDAFFDYGAFEDGVFTYWPHHAAPEACVSGMLLAMWAYFEIPDERIHLLAEHLLTRQMADKGWNCRDVRSGASHSSFNTTICVLEGLTEYQMRYPERAEPFRKACDEARELLLQHRLYRSDKTGEIIHKSMTRMLFPPRWHYEFFRALDHFQNVNAPYDERLQEPIDLLLSKRKKDGYWRTNAGPSGLTHFKLEASRAPSRIATLRALRILKWWDECKST